MTAKNYPLILENWGEDECLIISRGHHDLDEFKKKSAKSMKSGAISLKMPTTLISKQHLEMGILLGTLNAQKKQEVHFQ